MSLRMFTAVQPEEREAEGSAWNGRRRRFYLISSANGDLRKVDEIKEDAAWGSSIIP